MPIKINLVCNRPRLRAIAVLALVCLSVAGCNGGQDTPNGTGQDTGLDAGTENDASNGDANLDAGNGDSSMHSDASDADADRDIEDVAFDDADVEPDVDPGSDTDGGGDEQLYVEGDPPQGMEGLEILGASEQDEEMKPLAQGDVLTWEQGLQGGFHIWGSFRATGGVFEDWSDATDEELDSIIQHYEVLDDKGELVATTNRTGFVNTIDGGIASSTRFTVILRRSMIPQDTVDDGPFEFVSRVEMPDNESYESRVWIYFDCCHFL